MLKIFKRPKKKIFDASKNWSDIGKIENVEIFKKYGKKVPWSGVSWKIMNIDKNRETFEIFGQKYGELEESQNYYFSRDVKIKINISKTRECKNSIKKKSR